MLFLARMSLAVVRLLFVLTGISTYHVARPNTFIQTPLLLASTFPIPMAVLPMSVRIWTCMFLRIVHDLSNNMTGGWWQKRQWGLGT